MSQQYLDRKADAPDNDIYATIKVKEIVDGLTPEDFKRIDKEKAKTFQKQLDETKFEESEYKEKQEFMGMSD